jgi:hypothetical protein
MTTVFRDDEWDVLSSHATRINRLEQGCPPFVSPPNSQLDNGWTQAGDPFEQWGYRVCDGQLEFRGHLLPGASGTICYTLPGDYRIFLKTPTWLTDIVFAGGFTVARIVVNMTTGDITIFYPAWP